MLFLSRYICVTSINFHPVRVAPNEKEEGKLKATKTVKKAQKVSK